MKFPAFKIILLWSILIVACACQPEDDGILTHSHTAHPLSVNILSVSELENDPVFTTLQAEASLASNKNERLHKSTHDYRIVETHAAVTHFKDYVSYSFLIDNPRQPPFTFDNYILRKQHDGTTEAFILRYAYDMRAWANGEKSFSSITAYDTEYLPLEGRDARSTSVAQAAKSPCTVEVMVYHQTPQDGTYEWTPGATCHHTTEGDQCQIIIEYIITCHGDSGGGSGIPNPGNDPGNPSGGENPGGGGAVPDNGGPGQPIVTLEPPLGPENHANTLSHLRESIEAPVNLSTTEAELQNKNNALAVYLNQLNPAVFQDLSLLLIEINNDPDLSKDDRLFLWERAKQIYDIVKTKEESATYHINPEEFFATLSSEQEAVYTENVAVTALLPAVKSAVGLQWPSSTEEWLTVFELIKPMLIEIGIEFLPLGGLYNAISDMAEGLTEGDYTLAGIGLAGVLMEFIPWTKLVKIGKALFRSGKQAFKIFKLAYPFLSQLSDALALGIKTVLEGNTVKLLKNNGDEIARISDNFITFKYTGYGGDIVCDPDKTTTVIGKWQDLAGGGTSEIIDSGLFKSGENIGGINALNVNTNGMDSFDIWNTVNKPWLEDAVLRGDIIRAVSDPGIPSNMVNPTTFNNLSYFAMEHDYLINVANYMYDPITKLYTP